MDYAYAVAIPKDHKGFLTQGKRYPVVAEHEELFYIFDDEGVSIECQWGRRSYAFVTDDQDEDSDEVWLKITV